MKKKIFKEMLKKEGKKNGSKAKKVLEQKYGPEPYKKLNELSRKARGFR